MGKHEIIVFLKNIIRRYKEDWKKEPGFRWMVYISPIIGIIVFLLENNR